MGRILLAGRLAARNVRRRPVEAALLVLAITAATATLTVGRVLDGVTDSPYERTREATAGPDVVASVGPSPVGPDRVVPPTRPAWRNWSMLPASSTTAGRTRWPRCSSRSTASLRRRGRKGAILPRRRSSSPG